ncbi:NAD(P)H-dependent oxidoreductase [Erysipelothrix inopinata]|uniref:NAD(P)H-dependent oxidoreductase n=1 Tax=Erysipelothrix inopinata TaxID=225084 RepID=A0A7G9S0U9_9FIRM|nr:NADPH-dependent FMN reductase [Erysipelothrix inopinata]QNN61474.1 NAD(P)H-dependent oxidoreductase [Erysipelothrix inopinata]
MKVIALTGSVSGRKTLVALENVINHINNTYPDVETKIVQIGEYDLQFSDGRPIHQYNEDTQQLIQEIMSADAIIVGTPTYQTSIPGALKNIFDLIPMNGLRGKAVGIIVTSGSPKYFLMAEQQLKPILSYLGAYLIQKYVFIIDSDFENNQITNEDIHRRIQQLGSDIVENTKYWNEHISNRANFTTFPFQ